MFRIKKVHMYRICSKRGKKGNSKSNTLYKDYPKLRLGVDNLAVL